MKHLSQLGSFTSRSFIGLGKMVFDIESDGLLDEATKVYCLSYTTDGNVKTLTDPEDMYELLISQKILIGHNIGLYDLPLMKKLYGVNYSGLIVDTMWLSWYLDPNRPSHALGSYGAKVEVEGSQWTEGDLDLMIQRCEEDVKINWNLWLKQWKMLEELYG